MIIHTHIKIFWIFMIIFNISIDTWEKSIFSSWGPSSRASLKLTAFIALTKYLISSLSPLKKDATKYFMKKKAFFIRVTLRTCPCTLLPYRFVAIPHWISLVTLVESPFYNIYELRHAAGDLESSSPIPLASSTREVKDGQLGFELFINLPEII